MNIYRPRKIAPLRVLAMVLRGMVALLREGPLLLLALLILSPVGPHLRVGSPDPRHRPNETRMICDYFGSRGRVAVMRQGSCPLITLLDRRND
ncbi:MAG: hypothetical protein AB2809_21290 [Candidatus Thiodiazotropha sp.]